MAQPGAGYVKIDDLFHMRPSEFQQTWGLTEEELRRELASGHLVAHGHSTPTGGSQQVVFYLPSIRNWVARKRKMPAAVRAKVEAAGGLERVDQFRLEQINTCQIDLVTGSMTLPDGTVLRDVRLYPATQH